MTDTVLIVGTSEAEPGRSRTVLAGRGCEVHTALSAAEALQACRELNPAMQFAAEVVDTVTPRFTRLGIRLVADLQGGRGAAEVDAGLLKAALVNLLGNAVDACLADDSDKNDHRVLFKIQCSPDAVGISVEDNGTGMSPEPLKKLFTVFYSTKGIKGTGLGLFIADKIVRQHGGDMVVESSPGAGSRLCIRLPRRAAAGPAPGSAPEDGGQSAS